MAGCVSGSLQKFSVNHLNSRQFFLEFCVNGQWYRICQTSSWDAPERQLACKQLGYSSQGKLHWFITVLKEFSITHTQSSDMTNLEKLHMKYEVLFPC